MSTAGLSVVERKEGIGFRENLVCGLGTFELSASLCCKRAWLVRTGHLGSEDKTLFLVLIYLSSKSH